MIDFFINRPIFAWVIAIVTMLVGLLAILTLPVSQYPPIAPPAISVLASYRGASAKTTDNTVTQIIEQKMTGLDNLLYFSSNSDSDGGGVLTFNFEPGTNPDIAWAQVQNKLETAKSILPDPVQQTGVRVVKSTANKLMIVGLVCEDNSMTGDDLRDYASTNIENVLSRVQGVGEVMALGAQYAMRIWLNPDRMVGYHLTPSDIKEALKIYNVQISAGQIGGLPALPDQMLNATINIQDMLQTPEQFGEIPLRINEDGSILRLRDVARIEIGAESYAMDSAYNGHPSAGLIIRLASGANALDTSNAVKAQMEELSRYFPKGIKVTYPYETAPFVSVAIKEVFKTLFMAIILVFLVMFVFLGNIRATLIPTIAVPVVLLGTFAVLRFADMSINMLTMFAMVLAIGLLVDDAIVVIENVERIMHDEGLPPKEATKKSMKQIIGALIGIGLVLAVIFLPMAFFGGSTGVIYRQFSITIITAMLLSVIVAIILTPSLCATMLKPITKGHEAAEEGFFLFRPFLLWFDRTFYRARDRYQAIVNRILHRGWGYVIIYLIIVACTGLLFFQLTTGYLPDEDQGMLMVQVQLPPGATVTQTRKVMQLVQHHFLVEQEHAVESCMWVAGYSVAGAGQNSGMAFIKLKDWSLRKHPDQKVDAVIQKSMAAFSRCKEALIFAFAPPAVIELGQAKGFDLELQDRGGLGHAQLMAAKDQLLQMARQNPVLANVRFNGLDDRTEYNIRIDWERAGALGVSEAAINDMLATSWGGAYVNDFLNAGRVKRVYIQGDAPYRMKPEDLNRWYVRNNVGTMVPFSAFAKGEWSYGPPSLHRYNGFPSVEILGEPAPGHSTGEAMKAIEEIVHKMPSGIGYEWTGLSLQERMASSQAPLLYAFSVLVIFLCLAALYESWTIPFSILLVLPLGVFGAVLFTKFRGLTNDVYFQIGLLTTMGLTAKNAILIVQFAREQMAEGAGLIEASLEASKLRLRPILMTSFALIFGVLPLAITKGAGAGAQNSIGTSVVGGMLAATVIAIFYIPLFFVIITKLFKREYRIKSTGGKQ